MASFMGHPDKQEHDFLLFFLIFFQNFSSTNPSTNPVAVPKVCGRLPSYRQQLGTADGPGERHPGQPGAE